MGFDVLVLWDRLVNKWESKSGFGISLLLFIIVYFFLVKYFAVDSSLPLVVIYLVLPIIFALLVFLLWVISTNRFFLKKSKRIYAGIIVVLDDDKDRLVVNKIVRKVINQINKSDDHKRVIKLKLLPSNFCVHESEINKYHNDFYFMYDLIIRIFVESGNYDSIEKIIVERFSVTFTRKSSTWKKRIFYNTIDLTQDMNLLVGSRDWQYLISNSGIDKKKYLSNFYNIIIYYIAFYAIYSDRYEDALNILARIFEPNKTIVNIRKKEGNNITLELAPFHIAEARLSTILVDLFFDSAIKSYHKADIRTAVNRLEQLEALVKTHDKRFDQLINMARWNYELGNIEKAISYTEQAKIIKPKAIQIYLNLGFFAILQDNVSEFSGNYKKIFEIRDNPVINWVDILDFQSKEFKKMADKEPYFKFSLAFVDYVFVDSTTRSKFKEVVEQYYGNEKYESIYKLGVHVLRNPHSATPSRKTRRKKQGKKRRK